MIYNINAITCPRSTGRKVRIKGVGREMKVKQGVRQNPPQHPFPCVVPVGPLIWSTDQWR